MLTLRGHPNGSPADSPAEGDVCMEERSRWMRRAGETGFVIPFVLFALVLMSTIAVVALTTAGDEFTSSRAMYTSASAFYAAEAGLQRIYGAWDSTQQAQLDALGPGDSLDLGWQTLGNGMSYRGMLYRWDDGDQPVFQLVVAGRSAGSERSEQRLSYSLTESISSGFRLGECCDGVATVRGDVDMDDSSTVSGLDLPPTEWDSAGVCPADSLNRAGLIMEDTTRLDIKDGLSTLEGDPPLVEATMDDSTFNYFNGQTWDSLKSTADFTIGAPGTSTSLYDDDVYPRYNADGTCDTSHPYNWGSSDPNDPCFDHFPVIVTYGDLNLKGGMYGQAILLVDTATWVNPLTGDTMLLGSEIDIEQGSHVNGVILGRGCVEIQEQSVFHGGVFVDGNYWTGKVDGMGSLMCAPDDPFDVNRASTAQYSQCAIDRAIRAAGLEDFGEVRKPGGLELLMARAFSQLGL